VIFFIVIAAIIAVAVVAIIIPQAFIGSWQEDFAKGFIAMLTGQSGQ